MHIVHVALGGCLTYPNVRYGITDDTGGHIAFVLGAALAQARRPEVRRVDIVTRAFDDPDLGADHARTIQRIGEKIRILRLATDDRGYLSKEDLAAARPDLRRAFERLVADMTLPPDVLHAHFADAAAVVRPTATRLGIAMVYTPHSLGIDKAACPGAAGQRGLRMRISEERSALAGSDAVIVSSRDEAERQVAAYGLDVNGRVHRIAPGVILPHAPAGTQRARALVDPFLTDPGRPMILAIARPVEKKNLAALLRAYLGSRALRTRANLVVLAGQRGPGIPQTPEGGRVIGELGALAGAHPGHIVLPERHAPEVVPQLYRLAAQRGGVFVNPALFEPFGLTLLEAAQAGLPVVATREGGPADILGAIGHGRLVDPRDTGAIAAAIAGLLDTPADWNAASAAGRCNIRGFDWDLWAARALRVYGGLRPVPIPVPVLRARVAPAPDHATPDRATGSRRILACDIDNTLTGCAAGAAAFRDWARTRTIPFVVATGRCISEARAVLAAWDLPEPDAFITAVGTEIHRIGPDRRLGLCCGFAAEVSRDWDRGAALDTFHAAGARMQAPVEQRRWKLACFGDAAEAQRLRDALGAAGLSARVVASHGRLIDVLAPRGGKAAALRSFARTLDLGLAACIAAGDSGNDADMLAACGQAILVGNALPEVRDLLARPGLYRARAHHAQGVLEGLGRLGLPGGTPGVAVCA